MEKSKLIDTTKFPYELDHSKCLNCQGVERLEKDKPRDSTSWQKGTHLCVSCQWHCAMLALETRRDSKISSELRILELDLNAIGNIDDIYFDEIKPTTALERLESVIRNPSITFLPSDREIINEAIKTLKQIVNDLGYNKLRVVC